MATMIEQMDQLFLRQMRLEHLVGKLAEELAQSSSERRMVLTAHGVAMELRELEELKLTKFGEEPANGKD